MGLVKVKFKVRSNKVTELKCCTSAVRLMCHWSFGTQNSMVTSISKFDSRKGQCQVELGQIRSSFQIPNLLTKNAYPVQFCLRIPKM